MKKQITIILALILLVLTGCEKASDVSSDIEQLREKRTAIRTEVRLEEEGLADLKTQTQALYEETRHLQNIKEGRKPRYILELELKQSHFTLDIGKHLKDEMNAVTFEIFVDEEYYNSVHRGRSIVDAARTGSMLTEGSFGNWKVTVKNKRIAYEYF